MEYPTVENGMLTKRCNNIYTINKNVKLPQGFKELILSMLYNTDVDIGYRNSLLFYNNETHMMILSNALLVDNNDINVLNESKKYTCALITHYDKEIYNCSGLESNVICDHCNRNALLMFDTKSYCSIKCYNEDVIKKDPKCNGIICYNCIHNKK